MKKDHLKAALRVILFTVLGFFQFSLVQMGWIYFCDNYQEQYAVLEGMKDMAHLVGAFSLLYPALLYILIQVPPVPSKREPGESGPPFPAKRMSNKSGEGTA